MKPSGLSRQGSGCNSNSDNSDNNRFRTSQ